MSLPLPGTVVVDDAADLPIAKLVLFVDHSRTFSAVDTYGRPIVVWSSLNDWSCAFQLLCETQVEANVFCICISSWKSQRFPDKLMFKLMSGGCWHEPDESARASKADKLGRWMQDIRSGTWNRILEHVSLLFKNRPVRYKIPEHVYRVYVDTILSKGYKCPLTDDILSSSSSSISGTPCGHLFESCALQDCLTMLEKCPVCSSPVVLDDVQRFVV